jgi:hypothetical protein
MTPASPTMHPRMTPTGLRMPSSSVVRVEQARFTPCVLGLLAHRRPRAHMAGKAGV